MSQRQTIFQLNMHLKMAIKRYYYILLLFQMNNDVTTKVTRYLRRSRQRNTLWGKRHNAKETRTHCPYIIATSSWAPHSSSHISPKPAYNERDIYRHLLTYSDEAVIKQDMLNVVPPRDWIFWTRAYNHLESQRARRHAGTIRAFWWMLGLHYNRVITAVLIKRHYFLIKNGLSSFTHY